MKKIKFFTTILAFTIAIAGAFAFNSKAHSKKFLVEGWAKDGMQACTIDKGQVDCTTVFSTITCAVGGVTVFDNTCASLYKH